MADRFSSLRRLAIVFLLVLLLAGVAGHLFFAPGAAAHAAQESTCPLHSGMLFAERPQALNSQPSVSIGERRDNACDLSLSAEISHPPTI